MYDAYINYASLDSEVHSDECTGFENVADATKWVSERFEYLMLNWASISENGLEIYGEVIDEDNNFCDCYQLRCGM